MDFVVVDGLLIVILGFLRVVLGLIGVGLGLLIGLTLLVIISLLEDLVGTPEYESKGQISNKKEEPSIYPL